MQLSENVNSTLLVEAKLPKLPPQLEVDHQLPQENSGFFDSQPIIWVRLHGLLQLSAGEVASNILEKHIKRKK